MSDISKVSKTTRDLVETASISRDKLLAHLRGRYDTEPHHEVDRDIIVRRIALALKAIDAKEGKAPSPKDTYDVRAAVIVDDKKNLTKDVVIDDTVRSKLEQDIFDAARQWALRACKDAGVERVTLTKRGGARVSSKDKAKDTPATIVDPDNAPNHASHAKEVIPTFNVSIPKPKATSDLRDAVMALCTASEKLLADASQTHALDGDEGLLARRALGTIIDTARKYEAALLTLAAKSEKAPKGAKRAALVAAFKDKPVTVPVEELN